MSKRMLLTTNPEISKILRDKNIPVNDGIAYLVILYYQIECNFIPPILESRILSSGIVTVDYTTNTVVWKVPLFEEQENGFEWISDWMDLFKKVNPERRGTKADVLRRMKKFFVNNPAVRMDDVVKATENYLSTITEPMYCKKSHKFIYEQDGSSMLLDYVESLSRVEEIRKATLEDVI